MIPHGVNGKISAFYLIQEILEKKLITFPENGLIVNEDHMEIRNVQFSAKIKENSELLPVFKEAVSDFLHLFQYVEADPELFVDPLDIPEELMEDLPCKRLSGMSWLLLFSKGLLHLEKLSEKAYILYADELLLEKLRFAESYLKELFITASEYADEAMEVSVLIVPKTGYKTERLFDSLSVTYKVESGTEKKIYAERSSEGKQYRESQYVLDKHVEKTLNTLSGMFSDLSLSKEEKALSVENLTLTYTGEEKVEIQGLSLEIPAGFRYKSGACPERDFVMWLPNEENEEEPEASVFLLKAEGDIPVNAFIEELKEGVLSNKGIYTDEIFVRIGGRIQQFSIMLMVEKDVDLSAIVSCVKSIKEHIY